MLKLTTAEKRRLKALMARTSATPHNLLSVLKAKVPEIYSECKELGLVHGVKYTKILYDSVYGAGVCETCGCEPVFISIFQGYKTFCSNYCLGTNQDIQEQKKAKCRETTGHDYPMQSRKVRAKSKRAVQLRYGVDNVSQSKEVQATKVKTFYERYGYRNSSQHPDMRRLIGQRVGRSLARKKLVNVPGKQYILQGYEPQALAYMRRFFKCKDIHGQSSGKVPIFEYFDGRWRTYFPDFYIEGENYIVEVKSSYTFCSTPARYRMTRAKAIEVDKCGYKFKLLLMSHGGSRIKLPKDWTSLSFRAMQKHLVQQGCRL